MPDAYVLIRAARYYGVAPWEMEQVSVFWLNHALKYEEIEHFVEGQQMERSRKKSQRKKAP